MTQGRFSKVKDHGNTRRNASQTSVVQIAIFAVENGSPARRLKLEKSYHELHGSLLRGLRTGATKTAITCKHCGRVIRPFPM